MNLLTEKFKEVGQTLLPVVLLVFALSLTVVDVSSALMTRFVVGAVMLLVGLAIFLLGVDLSMTKIGEHMSREVAFSKTILKVIGMSFLLGFLITVAEPDLLILGEQIEGASGGTLGATLIVWVVSFGVGIMISLGVLNLLNDFPLNRFMAIVYAVILFLGFFVSEEFLAISFDASGATTGALTTPFILSISAGLSKFKGGKNVEENSFGLVGVMSSGPILAIMMLSIVTGQSNIQGTLEPYVFTEGIWGPIMDILPHTLLESVIALAPIVILFLLFNFFKFKIKSDELATIFKGLFYLTLGLTLFLAGVNSGFMDMGRLIGMQLADQSPWLLIGIAFLMGLIVVLVEPAVHVLGEQIQDVTSGAIPISVIKTTLSIGVGVAIALSMVRIVVPEVKLWYFLLPGFLVAIILSFKVNPIFVGIAYDAGGVASGPMSATFVLAFAQGAADVIPTANVLVDGFGVIAMIAMTPILSIMILGTIFKLRESKVVEPTPSQSFATEVVVDDVIEHDTVLAIVDRSYAERVIDYAREVGATGATVLRGRGLRDQIHDRTALLNFDVQPERELILFVTPVNVTVTVADALISHQELNEDAHLVVFVTPVDIIVETFNNNKEN